MFYLSDDADDKHIYNKLEDSDKDRSGKTRGEL